MSRKSSHAKMSKKTTVFSNKKGIETAKNTMRKSQDAEGSDYGKRSDSAPKGKLKLLTHVSNRSSGQAVSEDAEEGESTDNENIVDLNLGDGTDRYHTAQSKRTSRTKTGIKKNKGIANTAGNKTEASKQLAAGWKIVNERLKDLEQLEKRNKSKLKFEVDKAFEMAK